MIEQPDNEKPRDAWSDPKLTPAMCLQCNSPQVNAGTGLCDNCSGNEPPQTARFHWMSEAAAEIYRLFPFGQAPHEDAIVAIIDRFAPLSR